MTSRRLGIPICMLSCHGELTPLNQIFFNQCIQDNDGERSFYSVKKRNIKSKRISDDLEIDAPDDYLGSHSENNLRLKQRTIKSKKYTANKNESSDEWEMHSDSSTDYEVAPKKRKSLKSKVAAKKKKKLKSQSSDLSEYEKMVQKNRDEKMALMKSLKLVEAKESFKEAVETLKPKAGKKEQYNERLLRSKRIKE